MGTEDKAKNKVQDVKGTVKEAAGKTVGNEDLEAEQTKAGLKDVGEKVKDAASKLKDTVTGK
jgi:uncharacterized protein YjbJ (UPF0337 family)